MFFRNNFTNESALSAQVAPCVPFSTHHTAPTTFLHLEPSDGMIHTRAPTAPPHHLLPFSLTRASVLWWGQLRPSSDAAAYCCQCAWTDVGGGEERTLGAGNTKDPQWVCAGH